MSQQELIELIAAKPLLTKHDLARRFNVTLRTVERWRASGKIPKPTNVGGPRWSARQIEHYERTHKD